MKKTYEKPGKDGRGNILYKGDIHTWAEVDHDLNDILLEFNDFKNAEKIGW